MFQTFENDRQYLEEKYHKLDGEFEEKYLKRAHLETSYGRMAFHGYEYDETTGMSDDEIIAGLQNAEPELERLPHAIAKARAIEYVLEHTKIDVNPHDYFIGIYSWNRLCSGITVRKWEKEIFTKELPEIDSEMKELNESGAVLIWPDYDHVIPDWDSILKLGFDGLRKRSREYRKRLEEKNGQGLSKEQKEFFDGIEIEYTAILHLIDRLYRYAEKQTHSKANRIAECLKHIRDGAPQNFYEALQVIYIYFMISESIDCYQVRSLGNGLDTTLYSFYQNDLKQGTFSRDEIREFLAYFLIQWSAIGNYWGQPFYLGGTDLDGKCKINDLSWDIIEVYEELEIYNPKIQIKVNENTPSDFLNKIYEMIRKGRNSFVFCCEPGIMKAVMGYGATYEEALQADLRGCYETGIKGNEVSTATGYVNALKAVLYALYNGYDKTVDKVIGIETGEIEQLKTFELFYKAVLKQWENLIDRSIVIANSYEKYLGYINPSSMYSATIENSLRQGVDAYQGGVKYNNSALMNCGFASMVDAVMAVKKLVYETGQTTLEELKAALDHNWNGYETLRAKVQNCRHKYGNGDKETDQYAEAMSRWFCMKVNNRPNARGGIYKAWMHAARYVWQGQKTQASPDGRKDGEEISKNASPSVGMDRNGVTALIQSITKLTPYLYPEAFTLDVMLHVSAVSGKNGTDIMDALLKTYMKQNGMCMQFNVVNLDILKEAQIRPEKFKNLQVRVCGWNVLWNNLSKEEQDAYICRAEYIQ